MRWLPILLLGCFNPPDLPLVDEVPIVPNDRCSASREAFVACVLDGDTFDVGQCGDDGERIRMLGIDAPEVARSPEPAECFADAAHEELQRLIEGRTVLLTFDQNCTGVFGRTLAYVWLEVGSEEFDNIDVDFFTSVNEGLIQDGYVRIFGEQFGEILYQQRYEEAAARAEALGRGLWGTCSSEG